MSDLLYLPHLKNNQVKSTHVWIFFGIRRKSRKSGYKNKYLPHDLGPKTNPDFDLRFVAFFDFSQHPLKTHHILRLNKKKLHLDSCWHNFWHSSADDGFHLNATSFPGESLPNSKHPSFKIQLLSLWTQTIIKLRYIVSSNQRHLDT